MSERGTRFNVWILTSF